jgi:hypothetical protein
MYSPFEEMSWPQFASQPHLKKLTLQEQVAHYNQYLFELTIARQSWIEYQNKGLLIEEEEISFLLQENGFYLLQENGSKIII